MAEKGLVLKVVLVAVVSLYHNKLFLAIIVVNKY